MSAAQRRDAVLLTLDVGNSRLRAALFEAGRLQRHWGWAYSTARPAWWRAWGACLATVHQEFGAALCVEIASVAPQRAVVVQRILERQGIAAVHRVTHADPWPFRLDLESPESVGIDRLANVAGLVAWGLRSAIAIDLGTAITIDVLQDGVFRGGLIAPGLALQARALHEYTAALPLVRVEDDALLIGRDTRQAIQAGIAHTTLSGTAATARRVARQLGARTPILLSGGWAQRLRPYLRGARLDEHLLFRGLWLRAVTRR